MRDLPPTLDYARRGPESRPALSAEDRHLLRAGCLAMLVGGATVTAVCLVAIAIVHVCFEWWTASGGG